MLKEFVEKILSLGEAKTLIVGGRTYADKPLHPVQDPLPKPVIVRTLTGLAQLVGRGLDAYPPDGVVLHVRDAQEVELIALAAGPWGARREYVCAQMPAEASANHFGRFLDPESFTIWLQTGFAPTLDRDALLQLVGRLSSEQTATTEDDGVSQRVTVRKGVALKEHVVAKPRVHLAPYRTFREIEQPASEFLFRMRSEPGQPPTCALFEADGGAWALEAVQRIQGWLRGRADLAGITIVA